jgi:CheY-like chemotaxis protein
MSARPLQAGTDEVPGAVVVMTDITAHRRHEDSLSRARDEAERANEAKSEFVSRMSHELRTPLNAILGFAQLLEMARLKPAHRDSVGQILKAGRHLLTLINEVLDISRIESGRLSLSQEAVLVSDVLREALAMVQPQATERRVRVDAGTVDESNLYMLADRQRLKQIVLNLLSNAVKYNCAGGMVTVSCQPGDAGMLRLMVTDTGPGIPNDKIDLLFSPFERLGAEQTGVEGTGIGLAISKRLAEAMGGALGVNSQLGAGCTFFLDLPRAEAPREEFARTFSGQLAAAAEAVSGSKQPTVLCIEDNPSNLELIERILAFRPEIRLLTALHGAAGIRLAQEHHPSLILLDVHLPDIDGREVLRQLKEDRQTSGIPVIVVSADATPRQEARLREGGAQDYLTKPLDVPRFLERVEEALQHAGFS